MLRLPRIALVVALVAVFLLPGCIQTGATTHRYGYLYDTSGTAYRYQIW